MSLLNLIPESARRRITGSLLILGALGWFIAGYLYGCPAKAAQHAASPAQYRYHDGVALNDFLVTPGKVRTTDKNDPAVCGGGSTKAYRKPGIQAVYALYGVKKIPGKYEIDHLISLELGGANSINNEWPQPYEPRPGAHEKDKVENFLHAEVCAGRMELAEAQQQIAQDWYAVFLKMPKDTR